MGGAGQAGEGAGHALQRLGGPGKKQGWELLEKACPASRVQCYQDPPPELMTPGIFKTQEKKNISYIVPFS